MKILAICFYIVVFLSGIHGFHAQIDDRAMAEENKKVLAPKVKKNSSVSATQRYFDCKLMTQVFIHPQYCCNYPKFTVNYLTNQACNLLCGDQFECVYVCYGNVFGFFNQSLVPQKFAERFIAHYKRHKNEKIGVWGEIIDAAANKCVKAENSTRITGTTYFVIVTCIYMELYLNCPKYEDIFVCTKIDELIRNPRNCFNAKYPYFVTDFWHQIESDELDRMKKEENDCNEVYDIFKHPYVCCSSYPFRLFITQPNECDKCPNDSTFTNCYFLCVNDKYKLARNFNFSAESFVHFFMENYSNSSDMYEPWRDIVARSFDECNEHFSFHLLRGRKHQDGIVIMHMVECIFKLNFLYCDHGDQVPSDCHLLKSYVANAPFCSHTDYKLLPIEFYGEERWKLRH